jgi:hypothetical protein
VVDFNGFLLNRFMKMKLMMCERLNSNRMKKNDMKFILLDEFYVCEGEEFYSS